MVKIIPTVESEISSLTTFALNDADFVPLDYTNDNREKDGHVNFISGSIRKKMAYVAALNTIVEVREMYALAVYADEPGEEYSEHRLFVDYSDLNDSDEFCLDSGEFLKYLEDEELDIPMLTTRLINALAAVAENRI